ncbi:hypothetical protein [Streptomyces sp. NPDC058701]|uniref:hypothetical protein n=1 Tax=Streptomyces sp. NPDC058701 TaxID=3346608 RepID=UPI00364F1115
MNADRRWCIDAVLGSADNGPLVDECRAFRAEVLYDGGRRPQFVDASGRFSDAQPLDTGGWHITARRTHDGPLVGYVRVATPLRTTAYQSVAFLGEPAYAAVLDRFGVASEATYEHSRLVVASQARGENLGAYLYALAMATVRSLGGAAMIGISGTEDGQFRLYQRFGFDVVPGATRFDSRYGEDVCVIFSRIGTPAGEYEPLVRDAGALLGARQSGPRRRVPEPSPALETVPVGGHTSTSE